MAERRDCAPRDGLPRLRGPTGTWSKKGVEPTVGDAPLVVTPSAAGSFTGTRSGVHSQVSRDASRRTPSMIFGAADPTDDGLDEAELSYDRNDESVDENDSNQSDEESEAVINPSAQPKRNKTLNVRTTNARIDQNGRRDKQTTTRRGETHATSDLEDIPEVSESRNVHDRQKRSNQPTLNSDKNDEELARLDESGGTEVDDGLATNSRLDREKRTNRQNDEESRQQRKNSNDERLSVLEGLLVEILDNVKRKSTGNNDLEESPPKRSHLKRNAESNCRTNVYSRATESDDVGLHKETTRKFIES